MLIQHITLLTGHVTTHRLDTLDARAVAVCRGLLPAGGPVPAFPAYRVTIQGPVCTIWRGREPVVCWGHGNGPADPAWQPLAELQAKFAPVQAQAPAGRWMAVALLPGLLTLARADIDWLADFERCMIAAMILPPP